MATAPRVFALETEYSISYSSKSDKERTYGEFAQRLFNCANNRLNEFIGNGARLYKDTGDHPEYAAPETDNIVDAVTYDKAGERIFYSLCEKLQKELQNEGSNANIRFFKNNCHKDESWGGHENYLASREISFDVYTAQLIPFLVTRIIYSGAGKTKLVNEGKYEGEYEISSRASFIKEEKSPTTTQGRGIVNTRDEPHSDNKKFYRIHLLMGDSNMCELATALKLGTTSILLRLIEDGVCPTIELANPVANFHDMSKDLGIKQKYLIKNGESLSAVGIQRKYFDAAEKHYTDIKNQLKEPYMDAIMKMWDFALNKLENNKLEELVGLLDWPTKKYFIKGRMDRKKREGDKEAFKFDLEYHRIFPKGLYQLSVENDKDCLFYRVCSDKDIERATKEPPKTTRAYKRGEYVTSNDVAGVDWSYITLKNGQTLISDDPRDVEFRPR